MAAHPDELDDARAPEPTEQVVSMSRRLLALRLRLTEPAPEPEAPDESELEPRIRGQQDDAPP